MRRAEGLATRARRALRRRERLLAALYLGATALAFAVSVTPSLRAPLLERAEAALRYWDDRWTRRVETGAALADAGQHEAAAAYLERLDEAFPARLAKHGRDRERERVLERLAASHAALGRKRRALETYRRLVAFDPRNYQSHFALARACIAFREEDEALSELARVLELHPSHTDSVRAATALRFERGEFRSVVELYERYLDAFFIQWIGVELGGAAQTLHVPVDGRTHAFTARLAHPPGGGELVLRPGRFPIALERATLVPPLEVGRLPAARAIELDLGALRATGLRRLRAGVYDEAGADAALHLPLPASPSGVAAVRLRLRLFKPLDAELWERVARSYRNLIDPDGLAAARARSLVPEAPPAAALARAGGGASERRP